MKFARKVVGLSIVILLFSLNIFSGSSLAYAVTSTTPANAATGVSANQTYHVQFDTTMRTTQGTVQISPLPAVSGVWAWSANTRWYNCTGVTWNANTLYRITFSAFRGTTGVASDFVRTFTTHVAPVVSAVSPTNGLTDVGAFANYAIRFSEPMNTAYNGVIVNPTPTIAGTWAWSANKYWYNYSGVWDVATIYTITLTTNFRCDHEFRLTGSLVYSFTTDEPILVQQTIPYPGEADIPANHTYSIRFTDDMDSAYGTATIQPAPTGGAWSWNAAKTWYNYTGMTWAAATKYYVNLTGFICDDGFPLLGNLNYNFTTVAIGTTISYTSPADGASSVAVAEPYAILFNTTMNILVGSVTVAPAPTIPGAWAWSANTLWYNYTGVTWAANTTYWVNASALFESNLGFTIQGDRTHIFSTDAPPTVLSTSPADGAINVFAHQDYNMYFDDTMDITRGNITISPDADVNGTWAWSANARWYNLTGVTWLPGTLYTITIIDFTCTKNFTIGVRQFYDFETHAAPTMTTNPMNASTGIIISSHFDVQFTIPMNLTLGNITITPAPPTPGIWTWSANQYFYNYTGATWQSGTNYWLNFTNFTCLCQFTMQENKTRTFRTADTIPPTPPVVQHYAGTWDGGTTEPITNGSNIVGNNTNPEFQISTEQYFIAGGVLVMFFIMAISVSVIRRH
jgi:hypothetical protein